MANEQRCLHPNCNEPIVKDAKGWVHATGRYECPAKYGDYGTVAWGGVD